MANKDLNNQLKIIDEVKKLVIQDRATAKQLLNLDEDVLDLFETLSDEQRKYLAERFHQIFSINEEAVKKLTESAK